MTTLRKPVKRICVMYTINETSPFCRSDIEKILADLYKHTSPLALSESTNPKNTQKSKHSFLECSNFVINRLFMAMNSNK